MNVDDKIAHYYNLKPYDWVMERFMFNKYEYAKGKMIYVENRYFSLNSPLIESIIKKRMLKSRSEFTLLQIRRAQRPNIGNRAMVSVYLYSKMYSMISISYLNAYE